MVIPATRCIIPAVLAPPHMRIHHCECTEQEQDEAFFKIVGYRIILADRLMGYSRNKFLCSAFMAFSAGLCSIVPRDRGFRVIPFSYVMIAVALNTGGGFLVAKNIFFPVKTLIIHFKNMCPETVFFCQFFFFMALPAYLH